MRRFLICLGAFLAAAAGFSVPVCAESPAKSAIPLLTTDGRFDDATLIATDADWNWTFKAADGSNKTIAARDVVRYGSFARPSGGHRLRLTSGGEIVGNSVAIDDNEIAIEWDLVGDDIKLPRRSVHALVFDMPDDERSARTLEKRIAAATSDADTLLFANGDQLVGRVISLANDKLAFKTASTDFVVDRSRAAAVTFGRVPAGNKSGVAAVGATDQPGSLRTWVGLRDGSRVLTNKLLLKDDKATIELAGSATLSVSREAVVALQPIGGAAMYLSDLDDAGYRHIPFLSLAWDYRRDRNVTEGPLVADRRLYLKGLGMHSAARITYDLADGYRVFQSQLAIDDSTGGRGSVTCRVFTDEGSGKWQLKYESPIIRGGDKPIPVEVELAGAKRISLLVDFADRGDELDHVDWLEARLVK